MPGKIEDRGKEATESEMVGQHRRQQRVKWLDGISDSMDMNFGKLQEIVRDRKAWHPAAHGMAKSRIQLGD